MSEEVECKPVKTTHYLRGIGIEASCCSASSCSASSPCGSSRAKRLSACRKQSAT